MTSSLTKPSVMYKKKIRPAYDDYLSNPKSERLANILAAAIDNHAEWTFQYYRQNDPSRLVDASSPMAFREATFRNCPATQMMCDLADADQHRFLTRERRVPRIVTSSTAAYSIRDDKLWVNEYDKPFLLEAQAATEYWEAWKD